MADTPEFFLPGGDGKWKRPDLPTTLEDAQERILVLQNALGFYCDARSYESNSSDNEATTNEALLEDRGLRARIGLLAMTRTEMNNWVKWAVIQNSTF